MTYKIDKKLIDSCDVVSFDVFDTLLVRPFIAPEDLFKYIEIVYEGNGFYNLRCEAEKKNRKERQINYCTYDDIYAILPEKFHKYKEIEYELEKQLLFARREVLELYNYAKEREKEIIIVTDMYFSPDRIAYILNLKGIYGFSEVYVSGYEKASKWEGGLWKLISEKYNGKKIVHIGDTEQSDCVNPRKYGISTILIKKPVLEICEKYHFLETFVRRNRTSITASFVVGCILSATYNERIKFGSYWEKIGFLWGGPLALGLSNFVARTLDKNKIKEILFVARDGYTIKKIVELLRPNLKTHYFYAPRSVQQIINLDYENDLPWTDKLNWLFQILIENIPEFKRKIGKVTKEFDKKEAIIKNISIITPFKNSVRKSYIEYINTLSVNENRIGLFDISAGGFNSYKIAKQFFSEKEILGLYWVTSGDLAKKNGYSIREYQTDKNKYFINYELLELLITAPELPVKFIDNGNIHRVDNKNERLRKVIQEDISKSELLFAEVALNLFRKIEFDLDVHVLMDYINIIVAYATANDYYYFNDVKHGIDSCHSKYVSVLRLRHSLFLKKKILLLNILRNIYPFCGIASSKLKKNIDKLIDKGMQ